MAQKYDAIIIGTGQSGPALAQRLTGEGLKTAICERKLFGELHFPGRLRMWHVIKEIRRLGLWSRRPLSVLDAGGGKGSFGYFIAKKFPEWNVVLADNDSATLSRGRHIASACGLWNLTLREIDLRELNGDSQYDVVICSDVLEHLEDDEKVTEQLARALKPGGVIILTSPSVPQPKHLSLVGWRERRIGFKPSDYGHVRQGYSKESLTRIMENAGLDIDTIRWTFGVFGTLMFDLFFITGDNKPNPIVYLALFPTYMLLSFLDVTFPTNHGAAILAVGRKPICTE